VRLLSYSNRISHTYSRYRGGRVYRYRFHRLLMLAQCIDRSLRLYGYARGYFFGLSCFCALRRNYSKNFIKWRSTRLDLLAMVWAGFDSVEWRGDMRQSFYHRVTLAAILCGVCFENGLLFRVTARTKDRYSIESCRHIVPKVLRANGTYRETRYDKISRSYNGKINGEE
jgi:hypothetical protein